jgi:aryl carrier-like protein
MPQESPEKAAMVAPRTPLEALIARIWCEVLRLPAVGIFDNFIALGGDSMLAAQVVARLREATHTDLSLVHFLETPTDTEMAVAITVKQAQALPAEELAQLLDELEQDT